MNNEVFTDKRLLGALDYIDERFIAEVTESYTFEAPGEYKRDKKTVFKAYRRLAALAACLLLLSAAFPVLNYAVQRFGIGTWEGNAGAGESSDIELNEYGSPYERAIDAYPADMPAEEIYADVLKGGWVVNYNFSEIEAGEDLWLDFLNKVEYGEPARILIATYPLEYPDGTISIDLHEVIYDGKLFTHTGGSHRDIDCLFEDYNIFSFEYLTKIEYESKNVKTIKWMLTHKNPYTYEDFEDEFMSNNGGIGDHESIMSFYYYKN